MTVALPVVAGLLIGRLVGGTFKNLAATPIRYGWLFVVGLLLQLSLFTSFTDGQQWDIRYGHILYVISLAMVMSALLLNLRRLQWPLAVVVAGAALNMIVIVANGGAMPVDTHLLAQAQGTQTVANFIHHRFATNVTPLTGATRLGFLGDHFLVLTSVYSIGDLLLGFGAGLVAIAEMNRGRWPALFNSVPGQSSSMTQAA